MKQQLSPVGSHVDIAPMSVNKCWQGQRFKTKGYRQYEMAVMLRLPKLTLPAPPYKITLEFGVSSKLADWDNPVKPFQDILQKKYKFNDKDIYEAVIRKYDVEKGKEYISFIIETLVRE
jgi:Holliday junction resolvase RusA-like endonuclease